MLLAIVATIVIFMVMITLHEFGHFISAKLLGIPVTEFSVGFGPAIFKRTHKDTLYSIRAIPLGGYCKFVGEDVQSDEEGAFYKQKPWKKAVVLVSGAFLNVVLGFVLFVAVTAAQGTIVTNSVDTVIPYSNLAEAGIKSGDEIVRLNGKRISCYSDLSLYTSDLTGGDEIDITIKRDGEKISVALSPSELVQTYSYNEDGVVYTSRINGSVWEQQNIPYSDDMPYDAELVGKTGSSEGYILGFTPVYEDVNFLNIWEQSYNMTRYVVKAVYRAIIDLVVGRADIDQMSGPVGIVSEVHTVVEAPGFEWENLAALAALLTINLGIFNLLPFPALDGGRIVFVLIELVRRKPIPPEKEGVVHAIGMLLILALAVVISFNDIVSLFKG